MSNWILAFSLFNHDANSELQFPFFELDFTKKRFSLLKMTRISLWIKIFLTVNVMWKYRDSFNITRKTLVDRQHMFAVAPVTERATVFVPQGSRKASADYLKFWFEFFTEPLMLILRHFICHLFSIFAFFLRTEIIFRYKTRILGGVDLWIG